MPAARTETEIGAAVRAARGAAGLTQAELARQASVGRQWLCALEGGHQRAEIGLVLRVLGALGLALEIADGCDRASADAPWLTAAGAAGAIRDELVRDDADFALRLLARAVSDFRDLTEPHDIERFLSPPPSTGDHRWDTLLAATIGRECRRRCIRAPRWTNPAPLASWWFPDDDPVLTARTMQRTPIELQVKGIWLDAKALESL